MAERKSISKKIRFEVFKRDRFTCQYCGKMSPDVILEVDHIKPVCEGGENEMINLITACRDCNRGKGKTPLSNNAELKKQQKQLIDLADKAEQAQMMVDWKKELLSIREKEEDAIISLIESYTEFSVTDWERNKIKSYLLKYNFSQVWEATEIALEKYFCTGWTNTDTDSSKTRAIQKVGGILYNKAKGGVTGGDL